MMAMIAKIPPVSFGLTGKRSAHVKGCIEGDWHDHQKMIDSESQRNCHVIDSLWTNVEHCAKREIVYEANRTALTSPD